MKRLVVLALAATLAPIASAGLSYDFAGSGSGAASAASFSGHTIVEGKGMRAEVTKGDGVFFKDGSVILSSDGETLHVLDPSDKTYYDLSLKDLRGGMNSMFGSGISMHYGDPKVATRDLGDGGKLEGYPTRRSIVDGSFTLTVDAMGQTMAVPISMTIERWTTNQLDPAFAFLLGGDAAGPTGDDAFDKAFSALLKPRDGFPLKQVTTTRTKFAGRETTTSHTMTISRIRKENATPSTFALPAGYKKVASPLEKLTKKR
ncbi:MAG: DUF4412 domain-containing protein [Acidobacteria bacterium]|nr:DUF4412 domain-containing protein [Acidobacteriota bacterium]